MAYLNQGGLDYFWEKVKEYANSTITVSPKEASGSIATFDDGSETPVKSLSVNVEPVQAGSGDPSPENVRPISGWDSVNVTVAGKNILPNKHAQSGSTSVSIGKLTSHAKTDLFLPAGTYTISVNVSQAFAVFMRGENDTANTLLGRINEASGGTFTATFTIASGYFSFWAYNSNGISDSNVNWFQLELGSTATAYEPYSGTVYPISLPQTIYGGVLDVGKGELTVTKKMVALTSIGGTIDVSATGTTNKTVRIRDYSDQFVPSAKLNASNVLSDTFSYVRSVVSNITDPDSVAVGIYSYVNISSPGLRHLYAVCGNDVENYGNIVLPLATPLTLSLTPTEVRTILGYNNIYADSGNVDVVYYPQAAQKPTIEDVKTSTISVPTGTETDLLDEAIAVKAGHSYAISYAAQFAANSTGYRRTKVYIDGTDAGVIAADIQAAVSGAETVCRGEHWFAASSDGEVMIKGLQNSGGALSASTSIRVIDLGN